MASVGIQAKPLKSGKNSYAVWYKHPVTGKSKHYKSYRLKKIADQEVAKLRILIDTGSIPDVATRKKRGVITLAEVGDLVRKEWRNKVRSGDIKPVTESGYLGHLKKIEEDFGSRMLATITKDEILDFRLDLAESTSKVTANRRMHVFKQIFSKAEENGLCLKNILAGVKNLGEQDHERDFWLKPEQLDRLLEKAQKSKVNHYMVLAILLAAEHGASTQEILDLRWEHIDFDWKGCGCIHFHRTKNGVDRSHRLDMGRTKQALLDRRKFLAQQRKISEGEVDGYVVGYIDGRQMKGFKRSWRTIRNNADLEMMHFHDFRHTFCTNLNISGISAPQVNAFIGHKTLGMTYRYIHALEVNECTGLSNLQQRYNSGGKP
ncbi:tyrosine-type recombinase/integrase [Desulfoplanes sp. PS50]